MNRRDFSLCLAAAGLPALALAQPVQLKDNDNYVRVDPPAPLSPASAGKVEVVHLFWYACPHCHDFEPTLEPWVKAQDPAKVVVRRLHVGWNPIQQVHQRLFCTLDLMGVAEQFHAKVFQAIHVDHHPLRDEDAVFEWAASAGLDVAKFKSTWGQFGMPARMKQVQHVVDAYHPDGVPTLGIAGRWRTSPSMAGSHEQALAIASALIDLARKGG